MMAFNIPRGPRASRGTMRWLLRQKKAMDFALRARDGGGEREKARRVRNMVRETLRAENGVVQQFEDNPMPILQCDACGDDLQQDQSGLCDTCIEQLEKEEAKP